MLAKLWLEAPDVKTDQCGATLERSSPSSGLTMVNDDDDDYEHSEIQIE